jgi:hypothetical protein
MLQQFSKMLDFLSEFLAARKGLLPLLGIGLILVNLLINIFGTGWLADTNLFLHIGIIIAILGLMISWAL